MQHFRRIRTTGLTTDLGTGSVGDLYLAQIDVDVLGGTLLDQSRLKVCLSPLRVPFGLSPAETDKNREAFAQRMVAHLRTNMGPEGGWSSTIEEWSRVVRAMRVVFV